MDRAEKQTNKLLKELERKVEQVYADSLPLKRIQKEYEDYMDMVERDTKRSYQAYKNAPIGEERDKAKKEYTDEIRALTIGNKKYRKIMERFAQIIADVNQEALDLVNAEMEKIYTMNYNQVAVDCEKVGIEVE